MENRSEVPVVRQENAGYHEQLHPTQQATTQREEPGNALAILSSGGQQICCVEDWFRLAPPKMGSKHWKDGRSAKELAKAFCAPGVPAVPTELLDLLASSDQLGAVQFTQAWPEHKIRLDSFFGETRNADLAAVGIGKGGQSPSRLRRKPTSRLAQPLRKRSPLRPHLQTSGAHRGACQKRSWPPAL